MSGFKRIARNGENGMALIVAIGFLAVLSILGAVVMQVTTRDLQQAGGAIPNQQAFYVADRAVEYSLNRDIIVALNVGDPPVNLLNDDDITPGAVTHKTIIGGGTIAQLDSGSIRDLGPFDLPQSLSHLYGSDFGANLYHVQVKASATGSGGTQVANINSSIVRLFKMDDDTIFRTSGGG